MFFNLLVEEELWQFSKLLPNKQEKHMNFKRYGMGKNILLILILLVISPDIYGQSQQIDLQDLSAFRDPGKSWEIVGNVYAELNEPNELEVKKGTGVLVNDPEKGKGKDLLTKNEYGNIDLELDYLMAEGSNSGIYFQGQYELQLNDSWGFRPVTSAENGGVYERWDENRPQGQEGFQGYPPRQNVSRAPGLWQHLEVSFQAPRFDASGTKIENAKFIFVKLNGVTIHENVELFGPTRGSLGAGEQARGPLRFQGDHGAVAFRDIEITSFDKPRPELNNLKHEIYSGRFDEEVDYENLPPEFEGNSVMLTSNLRTKDDQFLVRFSGELDVKEAGEYTFDLSVSGGEGLIRINGDEVIPLSRGNGKGTVHLPKGNLPFELLYSKFQDWVEPGLGLTISGVGIREYLISDEDGNSDDPVDPILLEANDPIVFRSFMDIPVNEEPGGHRLTHAVSVGNPEQLHYTYDMNTGTIVQLWRGRFLDATPMWYSRGDGSSRPIGSVLHLGVPEPTVAKLDSQRESWAADTTGANYKSLGYRLSANDVPTFMYSIYGTKIEDTPRVLENAQGIQRTITTEGPVDNNYVRLVSGKKIEKLSGNLYLIGDKEFYLRLDNIGKIKPVLRGTGDKQELLLPLQKELTYSLLF